MGGIEDAKDSAATSSRGKNAEHRHGGIGLLTPEQVYFGWAPAVIEHRQEVLAAAYAASPAPQYSLRRSGSTARSPSALLMARGMRRTAEIATEGSLN